MAGTTNNYRLLPSRVAKGSLPKPSLRVLEDLVALAEVQQPIADLSRALFLGLRKQIGTADLPLTLLGIQYLAFIGDASGARLLAAYLDVTTAGARLIPSVRNFYSTRRQELFLNNFCEELDSSAKDWKNRALRLKGSCKSFPLQQENESSEDIWSRMRLVLSTLLTDVITGDGISSTHRPLLAELIRLETDAWEERIGRLAGIVNPFRISSVQRVLPILSKADMSIRDLRQLVSWVQDGLDRQAFTNQGFRALEVLEENEFNTIFSTMNSDLKLQVLAGLHRGGRDNALSIKQLGFGAARLMALDCRLVEKGMKECSLDLLSAVALVQQHTRGQSLALPLDQEQEIILQEVLSSPGLESPLETGRTSWSIEGLRIEAGQLVLEYDTPLEEMISWPQGLPTSEDVDPANLIELPDVGETTGDPLEKKKDLDASAIKHLVMSSIMSISVLLGFLRNPKVVAIPGLVAAVAERTRNPQVIQTIATDRALYTGFANRDVPLACLRSPCNVSPKTLRKFIHVKFVSKIDLKRMANDRTGIRKEVAREIQKYLNSLS